MLRTVALTGATGFIGGFLARQLEASGRQVKALVRPSSAGARPAGAAIRWIEGELEDPDSLQRLVRGADAVVHCAGAVRGATRADFHRINADGVGRMARAAAGLRPLPRFVLISSLAAREPDLSPYAASKRRGEEALASAAGEMSYAVFRPPAVYGPGDRELLPLFRMMEKGVAPVLGPPGARFSLLYVEDLAEAVVKWLDSGNPGRSVFESGDGKPNGYCWSDVADTVARLLGRRVLRVRVPAFLLHSIAAINLSAARAAGYPPMLTPGKVRELRHPDWVCDNGALFRATGWTPRFSLEEGLRRTLSRSGEPERPAPRPDREEKGDACHRTGRS